MAEAGLRLEAVILRHGFQYPDVVSGGEPLQALEVGCRGLLGEDVLNRPSLVGA